MTQTPTVTQLLKFGNKGSSFPFSSPAPIGGYSRDLMGSKQVSGLESHKEICEGTDANEAEQRIVPIL